MKTSLAVLVGITLASDIGQITIEDSRPQYLTHTLSPPQLWLRSFSLSLYFLLHTTWQSHRFLLLQVMCVVYTECAPASTNPLVDKKTLPLEKEPFPIKDTKVLPVKDVKVTGADVKATVPCANGQFQCPNGDCIPLDFVCDKGCDCASCDDENPARCPGSTGGRN